MRKRPRLSVIGCTAAALTAAVAIGACGSSSSGGGSGSGGGSSSKAASTASVSIGVAYDPAPFGYDPATVSGGGVTTFYQALYNSLFATTPSGKVEPELATSYKFNSSKTQLTLTLRKGVTFTDGTTLTSTLVKENLDRRSTPTLGAYSALAQGGSSEILNVATPNASTVVITFAKPEAAATSMLSDDAGRIVGGKAITDPKLLQTESDGSGPYTLSSSGTVKGTTYTLVKNAKSWDASSYPYSKLVFKVLTNSQTMANALISGQIQIGQIDPTTVQTVQSRDKVVGFSGGVYGFTLFDKLGKVSKPFASIQVRQALAMSIDRKSIASLHTGAIPVTSYFPPGTEGYDAGLNTTYAYNPTKAKQMLAAAGYPNGFSFTMQVAGTGYDLDLQAIKQDWQKIGVDMVIKQVPNVLQAPEQTPMGYFEFTVGHDPLSWVNDFVLGAGINPEHATDPKITAALSAAESGTGDTDTSALQQLDDAIVNEGWAIPVYEQPSYYGYDGNLVQAPQTSSGAVYPLLSTIQPAK